MFKLSHPIVDLAQSENKLNAEFAVLGGHENEHPGLAAYIKAFGECHNAISENHFIFVRLKCPFVIYMC